MRVLVMAGGQDAKWNNHLGVRRHFAPIGSETVLSRQIRQLRERGVDDIAIIAPNLGGYVIEGTRRIEPTDRAWGHEALNGQSAWSDTDRTIQLYGDTIFTEAAMDTVVGFAERKWQAFGRHGPGGVSRYGELFAISFWPEHRGAWLAALLAGFRLQARHVIRRAGTWEGYRIMGGAKGAEVGRHVCYPDLFTSIDDATDDVDNPVKYAALVLLHQPLDMTE